MSALTRHVLYEKFSREKAAENFFVGFLNDCELKYTDEYTDVVFYVKNDDIFMELEIKDGDLWVDYDNIWSIFEKKYKYNYLEIRELITHLMWKHLKLKDVTPNWQSAGRTARMWKHLKLENDK
jgi:hypothetical protein